jgi:hypothetical protein
MYGGVVAFHLGMYLYPPFQNISYYIIRRPKKR